MPTPTLSEAHLALTAKWSQDADYERAYLDTQRLEDGLMMFVAAKDFERPGIAISVMEALMFLNADDRADLFDGDAAVFVVEIRNFDIGPWLDKAKFQPVGREQGKPFMQWCVTGRVYCASGEIRELAYDCEKQEWTGPWFDFDTGVVR